ncbi:conserved hypothetical protein [Dehalogenimonas lykanthroporepellens BL-DC-9]|nr:conserved hypothetical protein [Dehalogenimonas lykanthroporepellens BL-DC-9]
MTEELGKIERPRASTFTGKRKLYVVPLLYRWPEAPAEYNALFDRYWFEIGEQLAHLEDRIGSIVKVYHEGIDAPGEAGISTLKQFETPSSDITIARLDAGAQLVPIEDQELMNESVDWERFVMLGFTSQKVARLASENLMAVAKKRYEHIAARITETLGEDEAGVLFIREGHQLQFPAGIEVFSVSPPSLDDIHRYLRDVSERAHRAPRQEPPAEDVKKDEKPEPAKKPADTKKAPARPRAKKPATRKKKTTE